jgi:hypothetical protein
MSLRFVHLGDADQIGIAPSSPGWRRRHLRLAPSVDLRAIIRADRSCCCTAKPSVLVVMPPGPGRPHQTDLLLCWHHYRASRRSLAAAGAAVIDATGELIPDVDWPPAAQQA